ncbi:MAG: hypothetical protein ATN33_05765 [Epulopiscium sp. Nele67-Bin001]|nr:MAG: hypothetical protein ATN33_05765 [Epulopiscium sp. Nele67-Bin001]
MDPDGPHGSGPTAQDCASGRGLHSAGEGGHQRGATRPQTGWVLLPIFPYPKKGWETPSHFRPPGTKQISAPSALQDVDKSQG